MAINVNTVYTTVLSILNKEQRGYITPYEFDQLANQVQLEIFENFFEDYNQYIRMPKTSVEYASRMDHIYEEFQAFDETAPASSFVTNTDGSITYLEPIENTALYTSPVHRLGSVHYTGATGSPQIELMGKKEYYLQTKSPILQPSLNFPIGVYAANKITVFPNLNSVAATTDIEFNYIRKPKLVRWGYSTGTNGRYVYDPTIFSENSFTYDVGVAAGSITIGGSSPQAIPGTYNLSQTASAAAGSLSFQTSGTGSGATLQFTMNGTGTALEPLNIGINAFVQILNGGDNYQVGDTLTISKDSFATGNPSQNITINTTRDMFMPASTSGSTNFEISASQQSEVVLEILKYSGIIIRDPSIIQAASQELAEDENNQKR